MGWEALGALAELLGAVAVLITVGYLAVQMKQNTKALQSSGLSSLRDVHVLTEHNEKYNALILKSSRNEPLTAEERLQMVERFYTIMKGFEVLWLQQQVGTITVDQFKQHIDLVRWALTAPAARQMWTELQSTFAADFIEVIEQEVLAAEAPPSQMNKAFEALKQPR